jgi:hypothetical protein
VIKEVERGLEHRLSDIVSQTFEKAGGVDTVAEILNLADRSTEKGIMEGLEAEDPDLVEQIRRLMFVFEDILLVNDKGIQSVLKEVDNEELSLALKTASQELKDKIFKNMSERAAQLISRGHAVHGPGARQRRGIGPAEDRGYRPPPGRRRRDHHRRPRRREGDGRVKLEFAALEHVELLEDESVSPGGCRLFTRQGLIDADLQSQINRIAEEMLPSNASAGA